VKLAALALAVLVAHGGAAVQRSDYRAELDRLVPDVPGIDARIIDAGTRVELDAGDHEVVVLGYEGEPFLLIDEGGVYENVVSPSTYLNRSLEGETPPPEASFDSEPEWEQVDDGQVARWHDHALHVPPGQAIGARDESAWRIPMRVDGTEVDIEGRLRTLPEPAVAPWLVLAGALAVACVLSLRFVRDQRLTLALLVVVFVADAARVYGIAFGTPTWLASRWEVLADQWALAVVGWGMTIAALVLRRMGRRWEALAAATVAAAVMTLAGGILEVDDLGAAGLTSGLPIVVSRAAVAVVLGAGLGVTLRAAIELRRGTWTPARPG
jgi:hypothetical protein